MNMTKKVFIYIVIRYPYVMCDNKLKEINIENCACYHLGDVMKMNDLYFENIILDKKLYEDIYIYYLGYKIPYRLTSLHIIFHKING